MLVACLLVFRSGAAPAVNYNWNAGTADWDTPANWTPAAEPGTGDSATVNNGGTATIGSAGNAVSSVVLGSSATGNLLITNGGMLTTTGTMSVGQTGTGTLTVSGGAQLRVGSSIVLGQLPAGNGSLTVTGAGTSVTANITTVGSLGAGTLNVTGGAQLANTSSLNMAQNAGTVATVTVDGSGSALTNGGGIVAGRAGRMDFTVSNGGRVTGSTLDIGAGAGLTSNVVVDAATLNVTGALNVGQLDSAAGSNATFTVRNGAVVTSGSTNTSANSGGVMTSSITVSGAGSSFTTGRLEIARRGTSTVTVADGGTLTSTSIVMGGVNGTGTLNIGTGGAAGAVNAPTIASGGTGGAVGAGIVNFSHTDAGYVLSSVISGNISLNQNGPGRTILTGDSTYTGATTINAGTLQLGNGGESGSVTGNILNNAALVVTRSNTYSYGGVISGTGTLAVQGGGTLALARRQTFTGATTVADGTLSAGIVDVISATAALNVGGNGRFVQNGFDQTLENVNNAGNIVLSSSSPVGTTLTVTGNYVGLGGTLSLRTMLSGDGSPSDRLAINGGTATGATSLRITRAGGDGAATTGNGILVVDATGGGTTTAGAFTLAGRVVGGIRDYELLRGSVDASAPQSWFLRTASARRPETSLYPVIPALGVLYGGKLLDTLDERWGDEAPWRGGSAGARALDGVQLASAGGTGGLQRLPDGMWSRVVYQHGKREGESVGQLSAGPTYESDFYALQLGRDLYRSGDRGGDRIHAGIYGAIGAGNGDVTHFDGRSAGTDRFDAYTVGGYWTYFAPSDWYVDAIAQGTWYDARGQGNGLDALRTHGFGYALSVEAGYPIRMGGGWYLEPQAQIVYGQMNLRDAGDAGGSIHFGNTDSLVGRVGLRVARTWSSAGSGSRQTTAWARVSAWRDFSDSARAEFSAPAGTFPFVSQIAGNWGELKGGLTTEIRRGTFLYGSVGYQRDVDHAGRYAYDGKVGVRVEW